MAKDDENGESFDEEEIAEGFDEEVLEGDDVAENPDEIEEDGDDEVVIVDVPSENAEDDDDMGLDQDVELALDEVLAETMRLTTETEDDDDVPVDVEDKTESSETILPKQDDEFRCKSCRLLKKMSQLADKSKTLCRDCV